MSTRDHREDDLEREIRADLELETEERRAAGLSEKDARLAAERAFGSTMLVKENVRDEWRWAGFDRLWQDTRYAWRSMRRNPAFTAAAVLSLALGIGANTAIFSLIDALMLRWLPVPDPQHLYRMTTADNFESLSYPAVRLFAEQKDLFDSVGGFSGWTFAVTAGASTAPVKTTGAYVTGGFYQALGLTPQTGRLLAPEDDQPGAPAVCVISDGYWRRQFGQAPIVGSILRLGGVPVTIVGVSPPGFTGATVGTFADVTLPVAAISQVSPAEAGLLSAGNSWLRVLVRFHSGLAPVQAASRLNAIWPQIAEPIVPTKWPVDRQRGFLDGKFNFVSGGSGWTYLRKMFERPLWILMGIVALVLLIACANVANLLLARGAARQREFAIRMAIGASRGRVIRQLLVESMMLALAGAASGLLLAYWSTRSLVGITQGAENIMLDLAPNARVLLFTTAAALATGLLFGLAPAFQVTSLKERGRARLLSGLVSVQVALSLTLLFGAGLFVRTLRNLQNLDPGFRREGVLVAEVDRAAKVNLGELTAEVQRIPGVMVASYSTHTPMNGSAWTDTAVPAGQPLPRRENAMFVGAGPRFFATLQTPLLAGREFDQRDTAGSPAVALVNERYAAKYFPGKNPVGEHLNADANGRRADLEIVGLVKNVNLRGLRDAPRPAVYVAFAQFPGPQQPSLVVRGAGSLGQIAAEVQKALQARLSDSPAEVHGLSEQVDAAIVQERMMAGLGGSFGALALILASIGLYGLLNYSVARRTREIGIRMALGAARGAVVGMEIRRALALLCAGIVLGLPLAWFAAQWVKSMLFGLTPDDPATVAWTVASLSAAGLIAAYLPARRAARVDPMVALRNE